MDFQPSEIQTLVSLGLTSIQARVYLTLVEFGRLNEASISKMSKVARPDVYRNLSRLQQLGLIEEIVKVPTEFQAVPVNTLSFLLQNKTHAYERLKFETEQLLVSFNEKQNQNNNHETENTKFILVPQKQAIINRISKAIEEAQNRIDSILSWKRFTQSIISTYAEIANKAWSRGIESRFIVENPTEGSNFSAFEFCRKIRNAK